MIRVVLYLMTVVLLSACGGQRGVTLDPDAKLEIVEMSQLTSTGVDLTIAATISNTFNSKVRVKKAQFTLESQGRIIAKVELSEPLTLPRASTMEQFVTFRVRTALSTQTELTTRLRGLESAQINGTMLAQKSIFQKRITINRTITKQEIEQIISSIENTKR